jgi:transposase
VLCVWFRNARRITHHCGVHVNRLPPKIGCSVSTLHGWLQRKEIDAGQRPALTTNERERLKQLERENKELRRANDILKAASAFFAQAELDRRIKS